VSADELGRVHSSAGTVALVFAWIAVGFAILSLPGALAFIPGSDTGPVLLLADIVSPVAAVLSWACAFIAMVVALVNVGRRRRNRRVKLALWLAAPITVLWTAALVAVIVLIGVALGLWAGNAAETAARPAVDAYTNSGAKVICENGDGGSGPDNRTPWFSAYLDVPDSFATKGRAVSALKAADFDAPRLKAADAPDADAPPTGSFAVISGSGNHDGWVDVYPSGPVPLDCSGSGSDYGSPYQPKSGRALVVVNVTLPDRK
jgi:hypothetical protein